jgi:Contractile injection system tape measure protein
MSVQKHIISKLIVDVECRDEDSAYHIKDNSDLFIRDYVLPELERYFDALERQIGTEEILQIDKLDIKVKTTAKELSGKEFQLDLSQVMEKHLAETIQKMRSDTFGNRGKLDDVSDIWESQENQPSNSKTSEEKRLSTWKKRTSEQKALEAWFYFIQTGKRPWWASTSEDFDHFLEEEALRVQLVVNITSSFEKLKRVCVHSITRQRMIRQFSAHFLADLASLLIHKDPSVLIDAARGKKIEPLETKLRQLSGGNAAVFLLWDVIFQSASANAYDEVELKKRVLNEMMTQITSVSSTFLAEKSAPFLETVNGILDIVLGGKAISSSERKKWLFELQTKKSARPNLETEQSAGKSTKKDNSIDLDGKPAYRNENSVESNKNLAENISDSLVRNDLSKVSEAKDEKNTGWDSIQKDLDVKADRRLSDQITEKESYEKERSDKSSDNIVSKEKTKDTNENSTVNLQKSEENGDQIPDLSGTILSKDASVSDKGEKKNSSSEIKPKAPMKRATDDLIFSETSIVKDSEQEAMTHLLVDNAGLIIIHPFLKYFFEKSGLLNEDKKLTDPEMAAHMLHYIATGKEKDFEHTMLFEKFLVGLPTTYPLQRNIEIPENSKELVEELLNVVRDRWKPLTNSSNEALRETFLQRSGKLIDEYPQPRLLVERKTVDILMGKLDWNISIVKLPWMNKILFVEW